MTWRLNFSSAPTSLSVGRSRVPPRAVTPMGESSLFHHVLRAEQELARPGWTHIYLLRLRCDSGKRLHSQGRGQLHPMQTRRPAALRGAPGPCPFPPPHSPHSSSFRGVRGCVGGLLSGTLQVARVFHSPPCSAQAARVEAPLSKWVRHRDAARGPLAQPPARQRGCVFTGTEQPALGVVFCEGGGRNRHCAPPASSLPLPFLGRHTEAAAGRRLFFS